MSASPSWLQVTALGTIACVCSTNVSGSSEWNISSTEGRRPLASARRTLAAARITGSGAPAMRASSASAPPLSNSSSRGAVASGTRSSASMAASETPLGLM